MRLHDLESCATARHHGETDEFPVVIIGAGPAGLTAAYELSRHNLRCVVLEKDSDVGGLARTVDYKGYRFDIGGHRFFTKVARVERMWRDVLGPDLLTRPRLSRIYYNSRFFHYPLEPANALRKLGAVEALRCALSYAKARIAPQRPEADFETWVSNRFGRRLFEIFFKTYTEKVWGISCREIQAEWAAQRIRGLSLASLVWSSLRRNRNGNQRRAIKTLIHEFHYPRLGPGLMWSRTRDIVEARNSRVVLEAPVEKIFWEPGRVLGVRASGRLYTGQHFISSMPLREWIERLDPRPPESLREAAADFHYRDFLTVALIVRGKNLFPDNWIYIHSPRVQVGRIQNYNNWSPDLVPDPETTCLGLEYFCSEGDELWSRPDRELIDLGLRETAHLGLLRAEAVLDGTVVRVRQAYPVYDETYRRGLAAVRRFLERLPNLQLVGRNGMHHYNNQDHSMLTAMLAAANILGAHHDLWKVNLDQEHHEEGPGRTDLDFAALEATQPLVPRKMAASR